MKSRKVSELRKIEVLRNFTRHPALSDAIANLLKAEVIIQKKALKK